MATIIYIIRVQQNNKYKKIHHSEMAYNNNFPKPNIEPDKMARYQATYACSLQTPWTPPHSVKHLHTHAKRHVPLLTSLKWFTSF